MYPLYILSGGKSSRFGSDKALARLHGRPLLLHVHELFKGYSSETLILSGDKDNYPTLPFSCLPDITPNQGPLGGLATALAHHSTKAPAWFFLVSCDLAGIQHTWIEQLLQHTDTNTHAIIYRDQHYWEPLFALYHTSIAPLVQQQLDNGQRAMWKLLEAANTTALPKPADWHKATQINHPDDLLTHIHKGS